MKPHRNKAADGRRAPTREEQAAAWLTVDGRRREACAFSGCPQPAIMYLDSEHVCPAHADRAAWA